MLIFFFIICNFLWLISIFFNHDVYNYGVLQGFVSHLACRNVLILIHFLDNCRQITNTLAEAVAIFITRTRVPINDLLTVIPQ